MKEDNMLSLDQIAAEGGRESAKIDIGANRPPASLTTVGCVEFGKVPTDDEINHVVSLVVEMFTSSIIQEVRITKAKP